MGAFNVVSSTHIVVHCDCLSDRDSSTSQEIDIVW